MTTPSGGYSIFAKVHDLEERIEALEQVIRELQPLRGAVQSQSEPRGTSWTSGEGG